MVGTPDHAVGRGHGIKARTQGVNGKRLHLHRFVGPIVQDSIAEAQMSWIMALIVGGGTGWLVARLSGRAANPLPAIVLGVIGAAIGSYLVTLLGLRITVRLDQLVAGALGALILVLIVRR